jgi:hypothetical protein
MQVEALARQPAETARWSGNDSDRFVLAGVPLSDEVEGCGAARGVVQSDFV